MDEDLKASLFARKASLETEKVPIGDLTVVVRALSREEVTELRDEKASAHTFENRLIAAAMVVPELTALEVAQWLDGAPAGDSVKVMTAVAELSGIDEGAQKSSVRRAGKRQRT